MKNQHGLIRKAFLAVLLLSGFASCTKQEVAYSPVAAENLVIVTDNEPGSYIMVKIMGAVRSSFPGIHITYLETKKFDLFEGSFLLNTALQSFPAGTVVAGIVEPGAGSQRLVFQAGKQRVFAPDNTLSTRIFHDHPGTACYFVQNPGVLGGALPGDLSFEEFYSRAICSLIAGRKLSDFGSACGNPQTFPVQDPVRSGNYILGEILFTDNFGNCITNIHQSLTDSIPMGSLISFEADTVQTLITLGTSYSSVPTGENVCFINSSKLLELAVNYDNFSVKYSVSAGRKIRLYPVQTR